MHSGSIQVALVWHACTRSVSFIGVGILFGLFSHPPQDGFNLTEKSDDRDIAKMILGW